MRQVADLNKLLIEQLEAPEEATSLQRTDEWFEKRRGRFTGSRIKDLMSCGRSSARAPWGDEAKIYDFGQTAEKYIYNVGQERLTGLLSMQVSAKQMDWGIENEPKLAEQLLKDGVITDFEEMDFEEFPNYPNGGASVDGKCVYKGEVVGLEMKCTTSWDGHFARMYEPVNDKHNDFWQFQAEMLAMGVDRLLYVVAKPMTVEQYDVQIIEASKLHQDALLRRCKIADKAIELWAKYDNDYKKALQVACECVK